MKLLFEIALFLCLVGIPAQLYYWCVIRPVLLTKARFEMERHLQALESGATETTKEGKHAFPIIARRAANGLRCLNQVDLLVALLVKIPTEVELRLARDREIVAEAPVDVRKINHDIQRLILVAAIVNSPGLIVIALALFPFLALFALGCLVIDRTKDVMELFARRLWVTIYSPDLSTC